MAIRLWQRKQGFLTPPDQVLHAEPDSRDFPEKFRTRVIQWTADAFRQRHPPHDPIDPDYGFRASLEDLCRDLAEAYGRPVLVPPSEIPRQIRSSGDSPAFAQIVAHLSRCSDFEVLDFIDAVFQKLIESAGGYASDWQLLDEVGERLNTICEEEGVGYRWVDRELIRFDDPITYEEAVQPAIELLARGQFGEANAEFRRALECYRTGAWRDAITNASAAFESVLKVVTKKPNLTGGPLIAEARKLGVLPPYTVGAAESLEKLMNIVPAVRGQQGAHGLGEREPEADEHLVRLVITTAAGFIVFIGRDRT